MAPNRSDSHFWWTPGGQTFDRRAPKARLAEVAAFLLVVTRLTRFGRVAATGAILRPARESVVGRRGVVIIIDDDRFARQRSARRARGQQHGAQGKDHKQQPCLFHGPILRTTSQCIRHGRRTVNLTTRPDQITRPQTSATNGSRGAESRRRGGRRPRRGPRRSPNAVEGLAGPGRVFGPARSMLNTEGAEFTQRTPRF